MKPHSRTTSGKEVKEPGNGEEKEREGAGERLIMKGAGIDMKNLRIKGSENVYMVNIFVWGPGFFSSSALLMATFVQRALEGMYGN